MSSAAIYGFGPTFWVLPTLVLRENAGAAAVGFINCFSGFGGFVGPTVVGALLTAKYPFSTSVIFLSFCFLGASIVTFLMRDKIRKAAGARAIP